MDQTHPGHKECAGKVTAAYQALKAGRCMIGAPDHLANDLAELKLETKEFWAVLPELLLELQAAVPGRCYRGWRPKPETSGEPIVKGLKLWAFVWESKRLGFKVYLKFCLKESKTGEQYAHVRLHKNRSTD